MKEKQKQSSHTSLKYALLNDMSTEDLKNLIQQDCFGSEDEQLDEMTIELILDIISQREPRGRDIDVNVLWENFQTEYMSSQNSSPVESTEDHSKASITFQRRPLRFLRYAVVAALLCLLLGNCVAFASGFNLFDYIAKWTEETFQFEKVQDTSSSMINLIEIVDDDTFGDEFIKGELL